MRILFIGEGPPASGRFFYRADSGLYRATRDAFDAAFPAARQAPFLEDFRARGAFLVDLCPEPVDRLAPAARRRARRRSEPRLARIVRAVRPEAVVVLARSIAPNVRRALGQARWSGPLLELSYPGRWKRHRLAFLRDLTPWLRAGNLAAARNPPPARAYPPA